MSAFALPEMLRTPLEEVALRARHLGLAPPGLGGVESFLSRCPSPPGPLGLHRAMEALGPGDMHLLRTDTEELTPMGLAVAGVPAPPRIGLALMLASLLGCEEEVLTICALLSGRPLFYAPPDRKAQADEAKRSFAQDVPSDLYAAVRAFHAWERAEASSDAWAFCRENFLSKQAMLTARANRRQLARDLKVAKAEVFHSSASGEVDKDDIRWDSMGTWEKWGRVMGVLAAAFGSQLARIDHSGSGKVRCPIYTKSHGRVKLFPSSVSSPDGAARKMVKSGNTYYEHRWGIYMEKVRNTGGIVLYDINEVSPLAVAICSSGERRYATGRDDSVGAEPDGFLEVDAQDGKVKWSSDEVEAMAARRDALKAFLLGPDLSEVERVGIIIEIEDLESRLGILDLIGETSQRPLGDNTTPSEQDMESKVLNFVVSSLESNGGIYPMAAMRRMMKSDMDLYNAMGKAHDFAQSHSSILSLDKISGKWMYILKPGARERMNGRGKKDSSPKHSRSFWGPKTWVYFEMNEKERDLMERVRKNFRRIVDVKVSGCALSPEDSRFLEEFGLALETFFTSNN